MDIRRPDGLIELMADVVTKAKRDYAAGPSIGRHYDSAKAFLEDAGILDPQGAGGAADVLRSGVTPTATPMEIRA